MEISVVRNPLEVIKQALVEVVLDALAQRLGAVLSGAGQ